MKDKYFLTHYIPLISIMIASIVGFVIFSYDKTFKISIVVASAVAYFVWAMIHHHIHKDLNVEVLIEYLVICVFGVVAVLTVIL